MAAAAPQDLVAIFRATFHPTLGNIVDWSVKASDGKFLYPTHPSDFTLTVILDLNLDNVEFSVLPSGLHLVDSDVVYFTKDGQHGVSIFRRRKTEEHGQRGFRLSALGVLLARSKRPRPWRHVTALKDLVTSIYDRCEEAEPTDKHWELARAFFDERKVRRVDNGEWISWSHDLANPTDMNSHPTLHLPHLLRILGPSSLTIYKNVLTRRRILIYTRPPVEAACNLCYAIADSCYEVQSSFPGRSKNPFAVLGMVTLSDLHRLGDDSGWIACTTDAIFLEKPACYDLLVDLTHSGPRPEFFVSKAIDPPPQRGPTHRLTSTRFAWSDVKLWNELDSILGRGHDKCCSENDGEPVTPTTASRLGLAWADVWRVYEDACVVCAGLLMGFGGWRPNTNGMGAVTLDGDDHLNLSGLGTARTHESSYVRNLGMGIEGRPSGSTSARAMRRSSAMSWSSGRATVVNASSVDELGIPKMQQASSTSRVDIQAGDEGRRLDHHLRTTLAVLQALHAHATRQISVLTALLPTSDVVSPRTLYLNPKDMIQFDLSPLSTSDAKHVEWLAREYVEDTNVVIRRGWRDLLGAMLGYT